jgi:hypothetical protein
MTAINSEMGISQVVDGVGEKAEGAKALEEVKPKLWRIPADRIESPNVSVEIAVRHARSIARLVHEPQIHARFSKLPHDEFDITALDDLDKAALAAWYARLDAMATAATPSDVKLPAELVVEATELRAKLSRMLEYYLGDDAKVAAELAFIRSGTGHQDLINDLTRLAQLHRDHRQTLARDSKYFRAEDATHADELARAMFETISSTQSSAKERTELAARAWTLLRDRYDEVASAGRWLLRNEGGEDIFPKLTSIGRSGSHKREKKLPPTT